MIDPNNTTQQAKAFEFVCQAWIEPKGGCAKLIVGMHHLWEEIYRAQDQPRLLVCCNGEKPRERVSASNQMLRVERKWVFVLMWGHGFKNAAAQPDASGQGPYYAVTDELRDKVLRPAARMLSMEPMFDFYAGWSPVPNLAPNQAANPFLDGFMLELATSNDVPAAAAAGFLQLEPKP